MRKHFSMENLKHPGESKRFTLKLSHASFLLLLATFLCSLIAIILLVHNFGKCPDEVHTNGANHHTTNNNSSNTVARETATTKNAKSDIDTDVRLPRSIKPESYNLVIVPFLSGENFTFNGEVDVTIEIFEKCNNITLHALELDILWNSTVVKNLKTNKSIKITRQYLNYKKQFLVIETAKDLDKGAKYKLKLKFSGQILDNMQGFYKSMYSAGNETRWIASTQFQSTDARRAFPCFDEPEFKANFKITIARPKRMVTLSNMPLEKTISISAIDGFTSVPSDYVYDVYQESVKMSTYLVAFVVCDFVNQSTTSGDFGVWTRADAIQSTDYAFSIGPKILKFLEEFFDIKYVLPKLDLIAIPDLSFLAMENFGVITFRESALLHDASTSAVVKKMRVAEVVAHEIAHQWFGNLVTPHWWSDLWLNEGFARYMEHIIVDHIEPSWNSKDLVVINDLHRVFSLDALLSSHQISIEVQNPEQIGEIFDTISYSKGASIIRSMENFLGLDVFKRGLSNYLKKFSYKTATQNDLWHALTTEAKKSRGFDENMSVKEIMDTWTLQTGLPYLTVTRNYKKSHNESKNEPLWWIPITFTTKTELNFSNTKPTQWIKAVKSMNIQQDIDPKDWIIFNPQVAHYYRVNYDLQNWKLIIHHLNDPTRFNEISPANRAQLIDDAMNLARADILDYSVALDVTKYLKHETECVPWKTAISNLFYIDSMLIRSPDYNLMKVICAKIKYFMSRIQDIYGQLGFEDEGDTLTMLNRFEISKAACHLGVGDCIAKAIQNFHKWKIESSPDINNPIPPNLKSIVYCTAIKYGGQEEWDFAWDRLLNTTMSTEKELIITSLGCAREPWLLSRYLERALVGDGLRKQNIFRVFASVSSNVWGQPIAFNFIKDNWKRLKNHFGNSPVSHFNSLFKLVARKMTDKGQLEALKNLDDKELKEGRSLNQAIEQAEANIAWLDKNLRKIVSWLKENSD